MADLRALPTEGIEWIRLRESRGLTRAELARRIHVDPVTLWQLEHDRHVSDRVRLLAAAALGLEVFPPVREAVPA